MYLKICISEPGMVELYWCVAKHHGVAPCAHGLADLAFLQSVCHSISPHACFVQPDLDELRIEERVTEEFMGAAPRAAALSGSGLRRRPTFRVRHMMPPASG